MRNLATLALVLALPLAGCDPDGPQQQQQGPPEAAIGHNILGTALLGQQKWIDAENAFRAAIEAGAKEPVPHNNIAVALVQQGKIDEAEAALDAALAIDPEFPYARYNMGLIEKNRGDAEAAVGHFEAVKAQAPDDLLTLYSLGSVYAQLGRGQQARASYEAALALNPSHVSTLYGLGRFLLQNGEQEEGARMIRLSQEIRSRSGLDEAVGTQYGEQGPFAMGVDYPGDALAAPAPIDVAFAAAGNVEATGPAIAFTRDGAGATRLLASADSRVLAVSADTSANTSVDELVAARGTILALAAGDVDDDAQVDLVIASETGEGLEVEIHRQTAAGYAPLDTADPIAVTLPDGAAPVAMTLVDSDHDGDLDLFLCAAVAGCVLATNDGAGSFAARPANELGLDIAMGPGPLQVGFSDIDNDRDVDLLALTAMGVQVFSNERDGTYEDVTAKLGLQATRGAVAFAIADVDKSATMDLLLAGPSGPRLFANLGTRFELTPLGSAGSEAVDSVIAMDFDNDGFLDVVAGRAKAAPLVLRNTGQGRFAAVNPFPAMPHGARVAAAYDANADGGLDVVLRGAGGTIATMTLMINDGATAHRSTAIESIGVGDNKFGIGAKVEVLAGALRQKFEVTDTRPIHMGLGTRTTIESVRHVWPSGVLQDEIRQSAGAAVQITQLDRKGTSCPLLYAWDGERWRFVTDFLGGAAVGAQKARGVFGTPDTDEVIKIEGGLATDADGNVRVRLNNQLEEVIWFDRVELIAVDHPAGTEVFPNERLMPGPPWPEYRLFASDTIRPVRAARGIESERDFAAALEGRDRHYVDDFAHLPFKGYAEPHTLELDLGAFPRDTRVVLLLDGWIDYADSSANIAAEQAGAQIATPRLTVADGHGGWRDTGHLMGFPAGLPKTMAVELTGRFSSDDHRVRIATNMRIYWDRARVLTGGTELPIVETRADAVHAELRFGGFPDPIRPDGRKPLAYDPAQVVANGGWKSHAGAYTAFGDVRGLLSAIDDRFVTTRNGDEIELRFTAPPGPAPGQTRTWLLFTDGFGKDMDPNSAAGTAVGPMPFHGMPEYPYGDDVVPPAAPSQATRVVLHGSDGHAGALPQALAHRDAGD